MKGMHGADSEAGHEVVHEAVQAAARSRRQPGLQLFLSVCMKLRTRSSQAYCKLEATCMLVELYIAVCNTRAFQAPQQRLLCNPEKSSPGCSLVKKSAAQGIAQADAIFKWS